MAEIGVAAAQMTAAALLAAAAKEDKIDKNPAMRQHGGIFVNSSFYYKAIFEK